MTRSFSRAQLRVHAIFAQVWNRDAADYASAWFRTHARVFIFTPRGDQDYEEMVRYAALRETRAKTLTPRTFLVNKGDKLIPVIEQRRI
jgi:hypothetical protein